MILLKGKFIKYIYQNVENNFLVAIFRIDKEQDLENFTELNLASNLTISSKNIDISINKTYQVNIVKSKSKKYEDSYELVSLEKMEIDSKSGAIDYLSSKKFPNVSKALSTKIIEELGINFLKDPYSYEEKLTKITSSSKASLIIEQLNIEKIYQNILDKFVNNNLSMRLLYIMEKTYQDQELLNFLENDVYSILEWNEGINFFDVDNIAEVFLKNFSHEVRVDKYIYWSLLNVSFSEGSTVFEIKNLYNLVAKSFGITKDEFLASVKRLIKDELVIPSKNKQCISATSLYQKELYIVDRLKEINKNKIPNFVDKMIDNDIDEIQRSALLYALNNPITIISGYPGTGKTTLVDKLVKNLKINEPKSFNLLAPTGKAAYQIFLKTNHNARTIHSFLGMTKGSNTFKVNEKNPSNVETLIIDEFSMINIDLFYALLIGCPNLKRLILIGDKNQLPSIGPGYLLNDIIASQKFKTFLLEKIYRQEVGSSIIKTALEINDQKMPLFNDGETSFLETDEKMTRKKIIEKIEEFIKSDISVEEYQILIPMYAGVAGIDQLNIEIQKIYSNNKRYVEIRKNIFYIGDKVIQIENDNELNVFNGEIGYIQRFNIDEKNSKKSEIVVKFEDGKVISYTFTNFIKNIKLAYVISIHKFQGSESKNIILVMHYSHYPLLSKKLLYTAITRAIEKLIIFGESKAISACINKDNDSKRIGNILELLSI